jgi:hypothetical protein
MIRKSFVAMAVLVAMLLAGCGGSDAPPAPPRFTGQMTSLQAADGDVEFDGVAYTITPASSTGTVLYGLGPTSETRAFLTFPLDGSTGGDVIPIDARVVAADLRLNVSRVDLLLFPSLVDLVAYPATGPAGADFASAPLGGAFGNFSLRGSDENGVVRIDVTPLVQEAVFRGVNEVQFRLAYDWGSTSPDGWVGFLDGANTAVAPRLTIVYE